MELNLNPLYPDAEWGFQAQQALEKLLKAELVLQDRSAQCTQALVRLAEELGEISHLELLQLQVFAVEARYEEGSFLLSASRGGHPLCFLNEQLVRVEYGLAEAQASSELNRELAAYAGLIQAQELVDVVGAGGVACVGLPGQIRSIAPPNLSKWGAKMYADRSIFRKAS